VVNLADLLDSTADGAFAVDMGLNIVHWNQAAQDMLGFEKNETIGLPCYQVLQGLDEGQRVFCESFCQVAQSVSKGEPLASYDLQALTKKGERQWVNVSIVAYRDEDKKGKTYILHLFRDSTNHKDIEALFNQVLDVARNGNDPSTGDYLAKQPETSIDELTPREREVLSLLAKGQNTRDIAHILVISPNTVRNHVQHILQKLHVHSRADAVARAIRLGLVD
jgi:PAS domain S-box-containing protein